MSLDKAIEHKKEKREPYRRAKAIHRNHRNNGSCAYCADNRQATTTRRKLYTKEDIEEYAIHITHRSKHR